MRRTVTAAFAVVRRAADRVWTPWRDFWFKPADPLPLGVMRILFGGMLFYTHLVWGMNLEGFFGPKGWQGDNSRPRVPTRFARLVVLVAACRVDCI